MELNGGAESAAARQSRRDWLRSALWGGGMAAVWPTAAMWPAASGCGPTSSSPALAGEIVGANERVGHWLRDGEAAKRLADGQPIEWRDVDVAIVGGGVAGLAAAYRLERGGCRDFVVLELEDEPGGTARAGQREGFAFPWGAHYLPLPQTDNVPLIELLEDMGVVTGRASDGQPLVDETSLCRDPQERLFWEGEWREDLDPWEGAEADELRQFEAFRQEVARWTRWRDPQGRRAFALPSSRCGDAEETRALDRLTMAQWLASHGWNSPRLRWFVDYACRDDYGMSIHEVSAWAGLFYFCARQSDGLADGRADKPADAVGGGSDAKAVRDDDPLADHAIHVSADGPNSSSQPLLTWPEGNGRLVRFLRDVAGSRVRTGCPVLRIRPAGMAAGSDQSDNDGRAEVIAISDPIGRGVPQGWRARRVICAAPQFVARRLIPDMPLERTQAAESFQYGSWMVANVHLRDRPRDRGFPLAWDNVDYRSDSLGYVVATHQQGVDHGPTVWTWYHAFVNEAPREARRRLNELSWAECVSMVLTDLERAHPEIRALATRVDVMRWGHAMIRPYPGFRSSDARRVAAAPIGNVHFAHSELSGMALFEEAFDQACRASAEVLNQLSRQ
jgi:protoporphyrinogen oxidase